MVEFGQIGILLFRCQKRANVTFITCRRGQS